jgi:hypothetical protein
VAGTYELDPQSLIDGMQKQVDKPLPDLVQAVLKRTTGELELAADGNARLQMSMGVGKQATGTWHRKGQVVMLDLVDAAGQRDAMGLDYDGKDLRMRQKLPTGDLIDLVWKRRAVR